MSKTNKAAAVEEKFPNSAFNKLSLIDVSEKTEEKNGLTYLSWAWAFAEIFKRYPDTKMEVLEFANTYVVVTDNAPPLAYTATEPFLFNYNLGYLVKTRVTLDGITKEMFLPVMDGANKAQKHESYTYEGWEWVKKPGQTKSVRERVNKTVEAATMFDINTTIMRCLVKNFAIHGLGHYIYAGEDLPEDIRNMIAETVAEVTNTKPVAEAPVGVETKKPVAEKPVKAEKTAKKVERPQEMPDDSMGAGQPLAKTDVEKKAAVTSSLSQRMADATTHDEAFAILDGLEEPIVLATGTLHNGWKFKTLEEAKARMKDAPFEAVKARLAIIVNHYNP